MLEKPKGVRLNVTIVTKPHAGGGEGKFQVASNDANSHVNIYMSASPNCLSPEDADKVRDLLIKARPLPKVTPTSPAAEAEAYSDGFVAGRKYAEQSEATRKAFAEPSPFLREHYGLPNKVLQPKHATPKGKQAYLGNGKHDWEHVNTQDHPGGSYTTVMRLRVPGGWIYETSDITDDDDVVAQSTVFVPVPSAVGYAV